MNEPFMILASFYQLPAGLLNSGSSVISWAWYLLIGLLGVLGCWLGYRSRLSEIVNRHEVS
ncbi:hypothetical protein [Enterococcus gallinarum]|uniref:ABC transporter permease n=1 Tax=Enterococcus gallinarum TaxID=1353 RepID=A0ABD4ZV82_ENTGA|nr:hypothetical protein [Enterococcus gallinarum]MBF0824333.1 hypothetical protein [Enterococcus faecalis]MBF0727633.1 hypothetical protein [Enterococcus gallinarum]MBF0798474.1 hypothetical protein [Enterococcus gallinarum]MBX8976530.1 hypothetical protein [Enterococcus gallinarum]MDL4875920.1 hypothetical protein [Enterococcus gallinarum]